MSDLTPYNNRNRPSERAGFDGFYNMLDEIFKDPWLPGRHMMEPFKIDVREDEKEYRIEAELPGIKKDEIDLDLNDGRLTISVRRDEDVEENQRNYVHRERRYGSVQRTLNLAYAQPEGIEARLEEGLLTISVPKQQKPDKTRRIEIH